MNNATFLDDNFSAGFHGYLLYFAYLSPHERLPVGKPLSKIQGFSWLKPPHHKARRPCLHQCSHQKPLEQKLLNRLFRFDVLSAKAKESSAIEYNRPHKIEVKLGGRQGLVFYCRDTRDCHHKSCQTVTGGPALGSYFIVYLF